MAREIYTPRDAQLDQLLAHEMVEEARRDRAAEALRFECWQAASFDLQHPLNYEVRL